MELNLSEDQRNRLAAANKVLGPETSLRFLMDDLLWTGLDVNKILRPGRINDVEKQGKMIQRLADLRTQLELVKASSWVDKASLDKAVEESIKGVEKAAAERLAKIQRGNR